MFEDKTMLVNFYAKPHGRLRQMEISNVYEEDIDFFEEHDIVVSMEEQAGDYILYGCPASEESEESEVIVLARGRSCEESMKELREKCEKAFVKQC